MRILWLYGPPGVGKSTTAWAVSNLLADEGVATAYVDIDQLGMVIPAPDADPSAQRLAARVLAAVAREFERKGARELVVSGVLDPALMPLYRDLLDPYGLALVRLTVGEAELKERVDARRADEQAWADTSEEQGALEDADPEHPVVVSGDGATPAEVARRVLTAAVHPPDAGRRPAQPTDARPRDDSKAGEAILVGGTQAVGKSTMRSRSSPTAPHSAEPASPGTGSPPTNPPWWTESWRVAEVTVPGSPGTPSRA